MLSASLRIQPNCWASNIVSMFRFPHLTNVNKRAVLVRLSTEFTGGFAELELLYRAPKSLRQVSSSPGTKLGTVSNSGRYDISTLDAAHRGHNSQFGSTNSRYNSHVNCPYHMTDSNHIGMSFKHSIGT
ncbi:hypothetical protein AG1IA_08235 [Rhizoctonia solani AG-1 IA]|uniref:Uncharacterized protein n=1 Tax=Thanatephorus cucumeris (strain AG1-IA) TaxID=983506 RepID=L8WIL8_THACA|nr:hypothetical protein AG1IA_08235 [Rhizoctonia solani AG-1 IA]